VSSYAEWFTRLMGNPTVVQEVQEIQKRKREIGYDPNHTTVVKGAKPPQPFRELFKKPPTVNKVDASDLDIDFGPEPVNTQDPDKLYCTFCGKEVQKVDVTREKISRTRIFLEPEKDEATGEIHITEKLRSQVQENIACPSCCLKIKKPIMTRRV
jgi:hypothetical protein